MSGKIEFDFRNKVVVITGGSRGLGHEMALGFARAGANLAIASLPGFTIPGDISGSDKYYRQDLVDPPIQAKRGAIALCDRPGLGVEPVDDLIRAHTLREAVLTSAY